MNLRNFEIIPEKLSKESFSNYGDVLEPSGDSINNKDFLKLGYANMSDNVPSERVEKFDVLDYWGQIANISQEPMRFGFLRPRKRAFEVSWLERHVKGTQTFIPLGGEKSIITVGKANQNDNPEALPDLSTVKAFLLDGDKGVNLHPGTWHWTPFPINSKCDFIILVRTNVKDDDLNFVDLESRLKTFIKININWKFINLNWPKVIESNSLVNENKSSL